MACNWDESSHRAAECLDPMLAGYEGYMQRDGYGGYTAWLNKPAHASEKNVIIHAACWAHARRKFVEENSKVAFAKLYTMKTAITAADLLNDRVLPFFEENGMGLLRVLTDRGTEYCGLVDHDCQLYLAINDIDHTKTKAKSPQTNGICERFHRTILNEFYQITFRKKIHRTLDELQADLDEWIHSYNHERTHQGKMCCGRTPMDTMEDGKAIWLEKADALNSNEVVGQSVAC
ncbi:MAG: DDE-type integrase/transposase/recombinase [Pontiellaceae bacterium]|nr:DDE-type integrase/transposase/recombinase [Pontiellaceae bacterium]MBN2783834.1 DDE-type integrase/transposase/recombinase [Pontiellaceae bacterium]